MFTGIIQFIGRIERKAQQSGGCDIWISLPIDKVGNLWEDGPHIGESIAIDGVCLTVQSFKSSQISLFASLETLQKTTLQKKKSGDWVNLERAATVESLLGGHLVLGHVDGRTKVTQIKVKGDSHLFTFHLPGELSKYVVEKGSICIDGMSLTPANLNKEQFDVWIIPLTFQTTTLQYRNVGDEVNIECDILAKNIEKLLKPYLDKGHQQDSVLEDFLK